MTWKNRSARKGEQRSELSAVELLTADVVRAIANVVDAGALVSTGLSRDRGAQQVTVTFDGEWDREWFRDDASIVVWLEGCLEDIAGPGGQPVASPRPKATQRPRKRT